MNYLLWELAGAVIHTRDFSGNGYNFGYSIFGGGRGGGHYYSNGDGDNKGYGKYYGREGGNGYSCGHGLGYGGSDGYCYGDGLGYDCN